MSLGHRVVFASLFANVSLTTVILKLFYPNALQQIGATLFGTYITDPNLQGWAFIALLYAISLVLYVVAVHSVGSSAVNSMEAAGK